MECRNWIYCKFSWIIDSEFCETISSYIQFLYDLSEYCFFSLKFGLETMRYDFWVLFLTYMYLYSVY